MPVSSRWSTIQRSLSGACSAKEDEERMTKIDEERETETVPNEEPVEEMQISDEASQNAEGDSVPPEEEPTELPIEEDAAEL